MKSMLYVGATLMIGASVYGFVDYKQTQNKKEFKEMYAEKKNVPAPVVVVTEAPVVAEEKNVPAKTRSVANKKKAVTAAEEAVSIQPIAEEDKLTTGKTSISEQPVTVAPSRENPVVKKKKRKISSKLFSRAPLREEEEVVLDLTPKKEEKKTASKEL